LEYMPQKCLIWNICHKSGERKPNILKWMGWKAAVEENIGWKTKQGTCWSTPTIVGWWWCSFLVILYNLLCNSILNHNHNYQNSILRYIFLNLLPLLPISYYSTFFL
jgi:hypothetical protein